MELSLKRDAYSICHTAVSCVGKQQLDTELSLPDYCGDIKRILHTSVQPQLHAVGNNGGRLFAEGEATILLLYLNEDDLPDCLEQAVPLSVFCSCDEQQADAVVAARPAVDYLNCRAVSPRRIQIGGTVSVLFDCLEKLDLPFVSSMSDCEAKEKTVSCSSLCVLGEKTFDLSETVALDENEQPVSYILRASGVPVYQSCEVAQDKILIKGDLILEIVCLLHDSKIRTLTHRLPIRQVLEMPGAEPENEMEVTIRLLSLQAIAKRDANDENRLLDLSAKVSLTAEAYREESLTVITDCYAVHGSLAPRFQSLDFIRRYQTQPLHMQAARSLQTGEEDATLLHAAVDRVQSDIQYRDGQFYLSHQITVWMLLTKKDGMLQYLERTAEVKQEAPFTVEEGEPQLRARTQVSLEQAVLDSSGDLQTQFSITVNGTVEVKKTEQVLQDAALDDDKAAPNAELILSFCKQGDTLWEIGKRYRTSVAAVMQDNSLNCETLEEDRMLLITSSQ